LFSTEEKDFLPIVLKFASSSTHENCTSAQELYE
jgi:hypothetical protein